MTKSVLAKIIFSFISIIMCGVAVCFLMLKFVAEQSGCLMLNGYGNIAVITVVTLCFYFTGLCLLKVFGEQKTKAVMKSTVCAIFIVYIAFLVNLTLISPYCGRSTNMFFSGESWYWRIVLHVNFIPFKTISEYINCINIGNDAGRAYANIFGNIAALAPFALFVPLFFKRINKFYKFLIPMLIISISIEILQLLLQKGSTDIDDVILNVSGAVIFYFLFHIKPIKTAIEKITKLQYV